MAVHNNNIIQLNCIGLRGNYKELCTLIQDHPLSAICLQETLFKPPIGLLVSQLYRFLRLLYLSYIEKYHPTFQIPISGSIQATALRVFLDTDITICFIYILPGYALNIAEFTTLLQQLPYQSSFWEVLMTLIFYKDLSLQTLAAT